MVNWDVTIGGQTIRNVFDVEYDGGRSEKLGEATVVCANTASNRSVSSGERVTIKKNGEVDFNGYVSGKPTKAGPEAVELEIQVVDKRAELKYEQVKRVFYQMDSGEIIRRAINQRIAPVGLDNDERGNYIHKGDSLDGWSDNIPIFDLGRVDSQKLYDTGGDFVFCGWPEGSGGTTVYRATFSNVPDRAIPGEGQVDTLKTRMLVNDQGGQFTVEVNLRDNAGKDYNWLLKSDEIENQFNTYELKAENAVPYSRIGSAVSTDGTLEYRFKIDGEIPEGRAAAIDFASTIPFRTVSRETDISPDGVKRTGNVITRRMDRSIFEMISEFGTEDGYLSYVDENDVLHYERSGKQNTNLSIDYNSTPVTDAKFNRDYENIINKVVVSGSGDIRVTLEDNASIKFYGISPREEPIVDEQIQTEDEAIRRGRGFLRENAWDDAAFEFEIADTSYQSLQIGQEIDVSWPPEDINGTYSITQVETDKDGLVTVSLTAADAT